MPSNKLRIDVPKQDSLRLGRVGLIAIVGFAIGIVWPRLAGLRLVPSVPSEKTETNSAELSGAPVEEKGATTAAASAAPPDSTAEAAATAAPTLKEPFSIGPGEVVSCRDADGNRQSRCDAVDFDAIARGRIATLASCEGVSRVEGVLSLGFDLDFEKQRVTALQSGKSTSLPDTEGERLLACLRKNLGDISLVGIAHKYQRYTVFYRVEFANAPEKKTTTEVDVDVTPTSGKATVAWDVALVRGGPTRDSDVVARILQGTRIAVTGRHGDWYRVKFDAKGNEGWVFRTAIGM